MGFSPWLLLAQEPELRAGLNKDSLPLSEREWCQLDRFGSARRRHTYMHTRANLRRLLSVAYNFPPDFWCLTIDRHQPIQVLSLDQQIFVSVSHSKGVVCCGLNQTSIGVDVEYVKPRLNLAAVARTCFNDDELFRLNQVPKAVRLQHFYEMWSAKEAVYKCLSIESQKSVSLANISLVGRDQDAGGAVLYGSYTVKGRQFSVAIASEDRAMSFPCVLEDGENPVPRVFQWHRLMWSIRVSCAGLDLAARK